MRHPSSAHPMALSFPQIRLCSLMFTSCSLCSGGNSFLISIACSLKSEKFRTKGERFRKIGEKFRTKGERFRAGGHAKTDTYPQEKVRNSELKVIYFLHFFTFMTNCNCSEFLTFQVPYEEKTACRIFAFPSCPRPRPRPCDRQPLDTNPRQSGHCPHALGGHRR